MITGVNKKWAADLIDEAIHLKGIGELVDGYMAKIAINFIDNFAERKLKPSEEIIDKINGMLDAVREAEWDLALEIAEDVVSKLAAEKIDIPGLDEQAEYLFLESFSKIIVASVKLYISKQ